MFVHMHVHFVYMNVCMCLCMCTSVCMCVFVCACACAFACACANASHLVGQALMRKFDADAGSGSKLTWMLQLAEEWKGTFTLLICVRTRTHVHLHAYTKRCTPALSRNDSYARAHIGKQCVVLYACTCTNHLIRRCTCRSVE